MSARFSAHSAGDAETSCPSGRRSALAGAALLLAGCAVLPFDLPITGWFYSGGRPDSLAKLCCLAEVFAHGFGAIVVMVLVYVLDPVRRRTIGRLVVMSLGVGLMADLIKLLLGRHRPYHFHFDDGVMATFEGWLPGWSAGAAVQSFPSSHSAVAAGLAIGLGWLYPRGKWLFVLFAALAMMQRIVVRAHFPSDVLWGAGVGAMLAGACLSPAVLAPWFDRFESRAGNSNEAGSDDEREPGTEENARAA